MVYTNDGLLFNLKKEGNSIIRYNTDETWDHYINETSPQKDKYCMTPLIWISKVVKFIES